MDPPTRVPLGDITNNITQGNQDTHGSRPEDADHSARKRQRERERFALMSTEKRNERNRKKRERRMQNKDRDNLNAQKAIQGEDGRLPVDEEDTDEWLHRGNSDENNRELHVGAINPDDVLNIGEGSFDDSRDDCFNSCTTPVVEGDVIQLDEGNDTQDISTGPNEDEGVVDEATTMDDQTVSPRERSRRRARAGRAALSPGQRAVINKRRRDSYPAKKLFKTPQEKKEARSQSKRRYRNRIKEDRACNLHPDSITMASPHFTPELVFPPGEKPPLRVSEQMEIPEFNGTTVYIQSAVDQSSTAETPQIPANRTIRRKVVTPGTRSSRLNRRNQQFQETVGRNGKRPAGENFNGTSQPTQSCVGDNGGAQTDARENTSLAPNVDTGTQTQPSVIDKPYSMPSHGGQTETRAFMEEDDCDENVIFEEDEEEDEGYLFAGQDNFKCFVVLYMEMLHPHELLFVKSSIQVNNQSVHYHIGVFERRFLALFPSQGGTFRAQRVKEREDRCRLCDDDMLQLQWPGVDAWQIIGLLSGSLSRIWTNYLPFGEPWSIMWVFFLLRTKGNLKEITV